jgi:hypothetical protein
VLIAAVTTREPKQPLQILLMVREFPIVPGSIFAEFIPQRLRIDLCQLTRYRWDLGQFAHILIALTLMGRTASLLKRNLEFYSTTATCEPHGLILSFSCITVPVSLCYNSVSPGKCKNNNESHSTQVTC